MTPEQLEEIRERADNATEGTWYHINMGDVFLDISSTATGVETARSYKTEDAIFIANARDDIPLLLAEIERLQEIISRVCTIVQYDRYAKNDEWVVLDTLKGGRNNE